MFRIVGELLHPIAQLRHMHAQVLRSLHIGHASLLDQAHSLKFELAGKLPSLHDPPPAPSKHPNSVSSEPGAGQIGYQSRQRIRARSKTVTHWPMIIAARAQRREVRSQTTFLGTHSPSPFS